MTDEDPFVGQIVERRYRVLRLLGEGGMGRVYEVQQELLGHRFALKTLLPELAKDELVVKRFCREAQAAGTLDSEHIVDVHDVGQLPGGEPYIVFELLHGEDLGALLKRRSVLAVDEAVAIVDQCVEALSQAHARGIVHRDIKPENIFLEDRQGTPFVKLLDFGISKPAGDGQTILTRTGMVFGTVEYMSPEQVHGEPTVDSRTDIWSMGVVLFRMLYGKLPFEGRTVASLFLQIASADPVELPLSPDVPDAVAEVIRRALAKDRQRRFASIEEFGQAFRTSIGPPALAENVPQPVAGVASRVPSEVSTIAVAVAMAAANGQPDRGAGAPGRGEQTDARLVAPATRWRPLAAVGGLVVLLAVLVWQLGTKAGVLAASRRPPPSHAERLDASCADGNLADCVALGDLYLDGHDGLSKDGSRAVALYQKACDAGEALGCNNLGKIYAQGRGVAQDESRAVALYEGACDAGAAPGCNNLREMYEQGRGVAKDESRETPPDDQPTPAEAQAQARERRAAARAAKVMIRYRERMGLPPDPEAQAVVEAYGPAQSAFP